MGYLCNFGPIFEWVCSHSNQVITPIFTIRLIFGSWLEYWAIGEPELFLPFEYQITEHLLMTSHKLGQFLTLPLHHTLMPWASCPGITKFLNILLPLFKMTSFVNVPLVRISGPLICKFFYWLLIWIVSGKNNSAAPPSKKNVQQF